MDKFYDHILNESKLISDILSNDQDMHQLMDVQRGQHDRATTCGEWGEPFTKSSRKVRHQYHVTGQYLFPTCNKCNLTLKMPNRKCKATQDHGTDKKAKLDPDTKKFFILILFHNLKLYDAHFIIKHFKNNTPHSPRRKTRTTLTMRTPTWPMATKTWLHQTVKSIFPSELVTFVSLILFSSSPPNWKTSCHCFCRVVGTNLPTQPSILGTAIWSLRRAYTHARTWPVKSNLEIQSIEAFYTPWTRKPSLAKISIGQRKFGLTTKWRPYKIITITTFFPTFFCWPTSSKISTTQFTKNMVSTRSTLLYFHHWHGHRPWSTRMQNWTLPPTQTCISW